MAFLIKLFFRYLFLLGHSLTSGPPNRWRIEESIGDRFFNPIAFIITIFYPHFYPQQAFILATRQPSTLI